MSKHVFHDYFVLFKFIGLVLIAAWNAMNCGDGLAEKAIGLLVSALFLVCAVIIEWTQGKRRIALFCGEGILMVIGVFLFSVTGIYFMLIFLFDIISSYANNVTAYLLSYLVLILCNHYEMNVAVNFMVITFLMLFYMQEKIVISQYRRQAKENEQSEGALKTHMEHAHRNHQDEIKKSHLQFENQMLNEKGRISQALHDKLGHSINGSVYKLEAAKLLIRQKPEECHQILQEVIDHLRTSMDEIRVILRQEKPDKKRMAQLSLQTLCEECEEKYHIKTKLSISDDEGKIPEPIWEVILDNTFEAVTNALKYAKCQCISIEIAALNEVVRCVINDDGNGAVNYSDGMGIEGMKQRVRNVHGYIDIESDAGFTINMILPITQVKG